MNSQIPNLEVKTFKGNNYEIKSIEGIIDLPAWSGYQSRQGAYNSIDTNKQSEGRVTLMIGGDVATDEPVVTTEQVNAYHYTVEHQNQIRDGILSALLKEYKNLQQLYGYDDDPDPLMPDVKDVSQFKSLIGLSNVHLLEVSKDGIAFVGYEFGCTWDEEHGLGVMTYKDKVIEIGGADTSFLTWVAEKALEPKQENSSLTGNDKVDQNDSDLKEEQVKKPWWKFW